MSSRYSFASEFEILHLPSYSPSDPAPQYSYEPACDEQMLQHTPRLSSSTQVPTGTYIKKSGKTTVILTEQEEGVGMPTYGRHGPVSGALLIDESESVVEVDVKIEGRLDTTISEGGGKTTALLQDRYVLWSRQGSGSPQSPCPGQIPFSFVLPSTFKDGETDKSIPPTYSVFCHGNPSLFLHTTYNIRVSITRVVYQKLGLWTKKKHIWIPFKYVPRTRAHRPILPAPCFFSSIKTSPEEWYQAVSAVKTRNTSPLNPLVSHLFLPAGRVYGMHDTIPFHLQLSGCVSTLRELFCGSSTLDRVISADSQDTATLSSSSRHDVLQPEEKPIIRVYLMRQVTLTIRGQKSWRNIVIGEGTLSSVPPLLSTCGYYSSGSDTREEHLDWEGELRCNDSVTVGGFIVANAQVKEFVIVNVSPPCPAKSALLEMQVSVPIRIVTDSWGDISNMDTAP